MGDNELTSEEKNGIKKIASALMATIARVLAFEAPSPQRDRKLKGLWYRKQDMDRLSGGKS